MIALAMPSVAKTRIGDRTFGRICLRTMRYCVVQAGDDYELAFLQCRDIAAHGTLQGCHCDAASTREDELAWPRALRGAGRLGGAGFAVPEEEGTGPLPGGDPTGTRSLNRASRVWAHSPDRHPRAGLDQASFRWPTVRPWTEAGCPAADQKRTFPEMGRQAPERNLDCDGPAGSCLASMPRPVTCAGISA